MQWWPRLLAGLKAFRLTWGRGGGWGGLALGSTHYNYRAEADGRGNAIVMACVRWVARTMPEAPLQVQQRARDGTWEPAAADGARALQERLDHPNPEYSALHLWAATVADLMLTGNAYWVKQRAGDGRPLGLWWIPARWLEPRWPDSGTVFISHYDYTVDGQVVPIPRADVVHFRDGCDPANIRKGLSPLASLLREIATDNEAANFTASILRNLGVPGVILTPDTATTASEADLEEVKTTFMQRFGGDHRGEPLVMRGPTKVSILSFSPEQLDLRDTARRLPEERVTAIFGTPAIVVGLGAGLDRSTFQNFSEAREAAYESMIIPFQTLLAAELGTQLVPDFGDPTRLRVAFDYSGVRVLQEDENAKHARVRTDLAAGLVTLQEARAALGLDAEPPPQDLVLLPNTLTAMRVADLGAPPAPAPAARPAGAAGEDEEAPAPERAALPAGAGAKQFEGGIDEAALAEARRWAATVAPEGLEALLDAVPAANGHEA